MVSVLGLMAGVLAAAAPPGGPVLSGPATQVAAFDLSASFSRWSIQRFDLPDQAGSSFMTGIELNGGAYTLVLDPHSVRKDTFQALVERDGVLVEVQVDAPKTYRGFVDGLTESSLGGSLVNHQLRLMIDMGELGSYGVQPVSDFIPGADADLHVVYATQDSVTDDTWTCGAEGVDFNFGDLQGAHEHGDGGNGTAGSDKTADIAFDMDNEFYTRRGSAQACIDDIEAIVAGMDVIYERDVNICHNITTIIIRDNVNDPYSGTDAETILTQFQNHWNSQQGGVTRDLAHMMAGRSRDGGILGIAYLSVVCNRGSAYGVSWTLFTSNMTQRIALTAHECGHEWGAPHCCGSCSGCSDCRIMCPCLGGCSGILTSFGTAEKNAITSFRNSRNCLVDGCNGGGGGGVPCADVKALKAKCRSNGTIKGKVILNTIFHDGENVTVAIDGNNIILTIDVDRAAFDMCCFSGPGHEVTLVDPANCQSKTVDCN
ncbi:MAG: hypothetical protein IT449_01390 [Phycisphaerales bacterium]|nr:hypothetical protein [Phycisphaerales bacterium]